MVGATPTRLPGDPLVEVGLLPEPRSPSRIPVNGSLNAGLAQWLVGNGTLPASYVASQGTRLGRAGRVHLDVVDGTVWVGGDAQTVVRGEVLV